MKLTFDGESEKSQEFHAELLASVECRGRLFGVQSTGTRREATPVVMLLGSTHVAGTVVRANLLDHTPLRENGSTKVHSVYFARDREERWIVEAQHVGEGTITTVAMERLVLLDPRVVDERGVAFLVMPTQAWLDARRAAVGDVALRAAVWAAVRAGDIPTMEPTAENVALTSSWFAAMLETRCRLPVAPGLEFQTRLFAQAITRGLAQRAAPHGGYSRSFSETSGWGIGRGRTLEARGTKEHGFGEVYAFTADHKAVEALLSEVSMACFGAGATSAAASRPAPKKGQLALTV